jgi:hypothetical protein
MENQVGKYPSPTGLDYIPATAEPAARAADSREKHEKRTCPVKCDFHGNVKRVKCDFHVKYQIIA